MVSTVNARQSDADGLIDVRFDCGQGGALRRSELQGTHHLRVEMLSGEVMKTAAGAVTVPPGVNAICINRKGTLLAYTGVQSRVILVPKMSATFIRGPIKLIVQAGRGEHETVVISWPQSITPLLDAWVSSKSGGRAGQPGSRQIAVRPIDPHLRDAHLRFETAREAAETAEPMILSAAYEMVALLVTTGDEVQLAALPTNLPETIRELTIKVRKSPALPWPLKDAADMASYSPFHFSRVFKALVGYGFHEYVDRCRTEAAVELLTTTDKPVDAVAQSCGFGTTQGLRESIKEHLGLVPSELRATPEVLDTGER